MDRFPHKLHALRKQHGMTQQQVAGTLGVSQTFFHKLEKGQKKPNVEMLMKIAQLFGVTMDQLARDDLEV
jgi:transcriptional regulator with XRE-family HTH domain